MRTTLHQRSSSTTAATIPHQKAPARPQRDQLIDVLRVLSAVVVVTMHWMSTRTHHVNGEIHNQVAYHGTAAVILSWIFQVMPILFITGGVANTAVIDRLNTGTFRYGHYLSTRVARMTTPVLGLAALFLPLIWVINSFMPGKGDLAGEKLGLVLWFLAVYIVVIAAAPLAVKLHDHAPILPLAILGGIIAAVDYIRFAHGYSDAAWVNLIAVWLFAHQLGIVYYRRTLNNTPTSTLIVTGFAAAASIATLVFVAGYPIATISTAEHSTSNMGLPTGAIALLAIVQLVVIVLGVRAARATNFTLTIPNKQLNIANNAMMGVYLWHLPVYLMLTGAAMIAPDLLLPADEAEFWAGRPFWFIAGIALLVPALAFATWWEKLWQNCTYTTSTRKALLAATLASFAIGYIWRNGIGLEISDLISIVPLVASICINLNWRKTTT